MYFDNIGYRVNCRIKLAFFRKLQVLSAIYPIFVCIALKQEMMDTLYRAYRMLLSNISTDFIRYLHDEIEWDSKLIAILGSRGVGKTTMLFNISSCMIISMRPCL